MKIPTKVEGHEGGEPVTVTIEEIPEDVKVRLREQIAQELETKLRTEGQRRINLIWEVTQAIVTVLVVSATLYIAGNLVLIGDNESKSAAFLLLSNAFFMIVTAYYQRTNHTRTGGVEGQNVKTSR